MTEARPTVNARLRRMLRFATHQPYHRLVDLNYRLGAVALPKRVGSTTFRSYDLLHLHGRDWLREALLDDVDAGDVVIDAGAHTGVYSLAIASIEPDACVHAVEPEPVAANRLRRNVSLNAYEPRIAVHELALGAGEGQVPFFRSVYPEMGSLLPDRAAFAEAFVRGTVKVTVTTLDEGVASGRFPPPDHVKIDVEGAEADVLAGAATTISEHRPHLYIDIHDRPDHPGHAAAIRRQLCSCGYHLRERGDAIIAHPGD